ncbi:hypothetical protein B0H16DRAFT_1467361 [Mycena metata]|uniref:Uncharacterized protein n=1 Tax=Mycena metata TaxID=1033252 RepID=A0AAD7I4D7_9AGAR|nr:hypothetical protein B0H16DRAFT_1467361 [Mycena metata]
MAADRRGESNPALLQPTYMMFGGSERRESNPVLPSTTWNSEHSLRVGEFGHGESNPARTPPTPFFNRLGGKPGKRKGVAVQREPDPSDPATCNLRLEEYGSKGSVLCLRAMKTKNHQDIQRIRTRGSNPVFLLASVNRGTISDGKRVPYTISELFTFLKAWIDE